MVSPSREQLQALVTFAARLEAERGARWEVPTVRDLGAIALRHLSEDDAPEDAAVASAARQG